MILQGKRILITGGTGSLGQVLIRRLLSSEMGTPKQVIVFSRDEAKQHYMRVSYQNLRDHDGAIDVELSRKFRDLVGFKIGDVRNFDSISAVVRDADVIFNTAALKQVPACEYFPYEAVQTNILGPQNIVRAIREHNLHVETVIGISTDKACKPVNVMGMTKAIQERVFICANLDCPDTRFICVRYGNVLASRGSVIPLFHEQIHKGGPVTITHPDMTRFLLSLNRAVDTVFEALTSARRGETYIPRVPSAKVVDIAKALIGTRNIEVQDIGIRPGEKLDEVLISEEEAFRSVVRDDNYFIILPALPELVDPGEKRKHLSSEYSSADNLLSRAQLDELLTVNRMRVDDQSSPNREMLR